MKNNKIIILGLTSIIMMSGCNKKISSSLSSVESIYSSSSVFKGYVDFSDAFSNTVNYGLKISSSDGDNFAEIYTEDMYYFDINKTGYVELDSDLGYLHSFSTTNVGDDILEKEMVVYGRCSSIDYLEELEKKTIKYIIAENFSLFEKKDDNSYSCYDYNVIKTVADHFQTKMYKYASEIEIKVGMDDKLEYFNIIEAGQILGSFEFVDVNYRNISMYNRWAKNGSYIDNRIYDYKLLIEDDGDYISIYEGEEVSFEATVIAKDADGNVYVANRNDEVGHIGIKTVVTSDVSNINVYDIVNVKGVIRTRDFNTYLNKTTILDTGKDAEYLPIFDEDGLVDSMGGGAYAANLFVNYPQFGDSLYSTYGYVYNMGTTFSDDNDIVVDLVFPSQVAGESFYHMEMTIPKELSLEKKQELFNELINAKTYGVEEAYELSLSNFLIKYDMSYLYRIKLEATEDSVVSKKLTVKEKLSKRYGLNDFPLPEGTSLYSYNFGGCSNRFLENEYGIVEGKIEGLFISISEVSNDAYLAFTSSLETYGVTKFDEVKDAYAQRHYIYNLNNVNIDYMMIEDQYDSSLVTIYMWVYDGNALLPNTIKDSLNEEIGDWFNVDNFLKLSGTYEADYTLYSLRTYAGKSYSIDNPLYCVTIDIKENKFDEYNESLIAMGYKTYRVNNRPYTYTTRGQSHYVYEKDGVYLDVSIYHTSDYTYTGHKDFEYRLEILIYRDEPISIETYDNLDVLSNLYKNIDETLGYEIDLPLDAVVEVWESVNDYKLMPVEYGYGNRDEAFVYTEYIGDAYDACKEGLLAAGYKLSVEKDNSALFSKTYDSLTYSVFLLKEQDKGYLRIMNDVGGVDFYK